MDMGIEPFLVASSLRLAVAQRLVRRICPDCKEEMEPDASLREEFRGEGLSVIYRGRGCETCHDTGYRGRTALFEVMPITERTGELIIQRATAYELRRQVQREGMRTLREVAIERMRTGVTTAEEILRETRRSGSYLDLVECLGDAAVGIHKGRTFSCHDVPPMRGSGSGPQV